MRAIAVTMHRAPLGCGCSPRDRSVASRQTIKRALRRRAAVQPVIGHLKAEHRVGRNYLAKPAGDAVNAVLAAVGYNFRLLLAWLAVLLRWFLLALSGEPALPAVRS